MKKTIQKIYCDGGSKGNPGSGIAVVKIDSSFIDNVKYKTLGTVTNNQAEYEAFIMALEEANRILKANRRNKPSFEILVDSQLVHGHIERNWNVNKNHRLVQKAKEMYYQIKDRTDINVILIPRQENQAGIWIDKNKSKY